MLTDHFANPFEVPLSNQLMQVLRGRLHTCPNSLCKKYRVRKLPARDEMLTPDREGGSAQGQAAASSQRLSTNKLIWLESWGFHATNLPFFLFFLPNGMCVCRERRERDPLKERPTAEGTG